jgi:hypothetical protein
MRDRRNQTDLQEIFPWLMMKFLAKYELTCPGLAVEVGCGNHSAIVRKDIGKEMGNGGLRVIVQVSFF